VTEPFADRPSADDHARADDQDGDGDPQRRMEAAVEIGGGERAE
jgi:hypothetical protein